MPDAARIAQAQALEVPLVLKGAKPDDGTGRRELFTENATTIRDAARAVSAERINVVTGAA